ncbi:DUF262 domain-containing protein [Vibrio parahaemolyticus]|nr:DUF262 domain-containing protein [Vibrio parahaemolyticus]ELM4063111.1 DUF262 domain-containing protein [Vibrio parahaemolyticus]HCG7751780.1 DUF262 domain-containing protein [Vibrio parahaemolyticus]
MTKYTVEMIDLSQLFHLLDSKTMVAPSFQRKYCWKKDHILDLMESIKNGYPIGMITVLLGAPEYFEEISEGGSLLPNHQSRDGFSYDKLWIVDGLQRISTLYNTLHIKNDDFPVAFDFLLDEFVYSNEENVNQIRLSSLFNSKEFIRFQREALQRDEAETLIEKANDLHDAFRNYRFPLQKFHDMNTNDVLNVFKSLNSRGLALNSDDLKKAMNYKTNK